MRAVPQNVESAQGLRVTRHVSGRKAPMMAVNTSEGMNTVRKLIYTRSLPIPSAKELIGITNTGKHRGSPRAGD
jgi:hypothetical protein